MTKSRRTGFTLAEVLITLAVIGVVAALTIPTVVNKYNKNTWESGFKECYNIIKQAESSIKADNGRQLPSWSSHQELYESFEPNLSTVKKCEGVAPEGDCFASSYTNLNGGSPTIFGTYSLVLNNGASIAFGKAPFGTGHIISIDTNGTSGPNVRGKDYIRLQFNSTQETFLPEGYDETESNITTNCPSDLGSSIGQYCGVRILRGDYAEDY